ncbi:MFS transporter [Rariglobus hedericola]|uniref:MFS transporter n=1 Tax=Rariglobus hedericola TaxID=2597822 RepID=A0A556QK82_9BACT|nr:MFS transporter [Rariglobus hedericola]TSJ77056.1 MFS transporter [Rariglobus hedericola]
MSASASAPLIRARLLTLLSYGAMMSLAIGLNLLPVFLTTLSTTYGGAAGLSGEQLGRLGGLAFAGLVVGIVITGPLADRHGAKPFAQFGLALIAISLVAMAFAPTYTLLLFAVFALGLGSGVLDMVLSPIVSALNPANRSVALNWLHSFYCVGAAVTVLAGSLALAAGFGWRGSCLVLLPLPLGLLAAFAPLKFPDLPHESVRTSVRSLFTHRWFQFAAIGIFLGGATELGMAQWLPAYAETSLGFPTWISGGSLLLFSVAMALGRMVVGFAGTRFNSFQLMAWSCASTVVLFILGSFLPIPSLALTACILAGFTGSCLWPTMLAVTADRYPQGGASMFGALAALGNAGGIFMPWLVGLIADHSNLHWGLAISALAPLAMLPLVLRLRAPH